MSIINEKLEEDRTAKEQAAAADQLREDVKEALKELGLEDEDIEKIDMDDLIWGQGNEAKTPAEIAQTYKDYLDEQQRQKDADAAREEARAALAGHYTSEQIEDMLDGLLFENGELKTDYKTAVDNAVKAAEALAEVRKVTYGDETTEDWSDDYIYALITNGDGSIKEEYLENGKLNISKIQSDVEAMLKGVAEGKEKAKVVQDAKNSLVETFGEGNVQDNEDGSFTVTTADGTTVTVFVYGKDEEGNDKKIFDINDIKQKVNK